MVIEFPSETHMMLVFRVDLLRCRLGIEIQLNFDYTGSLPTSDVFGMNDRQYKIYILLNKPNVGIWRSGSAFALHAKGHGFDPHSVQHFSFCYALLYFYHVLSPFLSPFPHMTRFVVVPHSLPVKLFPYLTQCFARHRIYSDTIAYGE